MRAAPDSAIANGSGAARGFEFEPPDASLCLSLLSAARSLFPPNEADAPLCGREPNGDVPGGELLAE